MFQGSNKKDRTKTVPKDTFGSELLVKIFLEKPLKKRVVCSVKLSAVRDARKILKKAKAEGCGGRRLYYNVG